MIVFLLMTIAIAVLVVLFIHIGLLQEGVEDKKMEPKQRAKGTKGPNTTIEFPEEDSKA